MLDPACGSGNFLYLGLQTLKDLEHRVQFETEALGFPRQLSCLVGPANVKGTEVNPYGAGLARVSVWIGEIQWMRRNGFWEAHDPILKPLDTIECRDAILTPANNEPDWPEADVVIGNPPCGDHAGAAAHDAVLDALHQVVPDHGSRFMRLTFSCGPQMGSTIWSRPKAGKTKMCHKVKPALAWCEAASTPEVRVAVCVRPTRRVRTFDGRHGGSSRGDVPASPRGGHWWRALTLPPECRCLPPRRRRKRQSWRGIRNSRGLSMKILFRRELHTPLPKAVSSAEPAEPASEKSPRRSGGGGATTV